MKLGKFAHFSKI